MKSNNNITPRLQQILASTHSLKDISSVPVKFKTCETKLVLQHEFGVTCDSSSVPILSTYGMSTCRAVALYNKTNKSAFLAHIDNPTGLEDILNKFGFNKDTVTAYIFTEQSTSNISVMSLVSLFKKMKIEIATIQNELTLSIDARTGQVFVANPLLLDNPNDSEERVNPKKLIESYLNHIPLQCCFNGVQMPWKKLSRQDDLAKNVRSQYEYGTFYRAVNTSSLSEEDKRFLHELRKEQTNLKFT